MINVFVSKTLTHFILLTLLLNDRQVCICVCLLVKCLLAGDPVVSRWCLQLMLVPS